LSLALHAQPGGLWHVRLRWIQLLPHALPLLQVRQQLRGSSAGLSGFAGSGGAFRAGSSGAGFSGACCAIACTAGAAANASTTNNTYLSLITIVRRYPRSSRTGSGFSAGER
jgi:hypothetical protein